MPELPEVETIVRDLADLITGCEILEAKVFWPRSIATPDVESFCKLIQNQKILNITRRGKFIVMTLSNDTILVHLRMTGKFTLSKNKKPLTHERVQLRLDSGNILHYVDQRKFGKWSHTSTPLATLQDLGLEPFSPEYTLNAFKKMISHKKTLIKPFLLNQRYIVGLGNIYVDEALWEAKIAPTRTIDTLTETEIQALYHAIPLVLKEGIANMGTSLGSKNANYFSVSRRRGFHQTQLKVFRRDGMPCPRCQNPIIKIQLAQRGTHFCPFCQK